LILAAEPKEVRTTNSAIRGGKKDRGGRGGGKGGVKRKFPQGDGVVDPSADTLAWVKNKSGPSKVEVQVGKKARKNKSDKDCTKQQMLDESEPPLKYSSGP
jgi:hypothetical protein